MLTLSLLSLLKLIYLAPYSRGRPTLGINITQIKYNIENTSIGYTFHVFCLFIY